MILDREILSDLLKNEEFHNDIIDCLNKLYDYTLFVSKMSGEIEDLRSSIENYGQDFYIREVQDLDIRRKRKHDLAMDSLNIINRICKILDCPLFFHGNTDEDYRGDIANLIFKFCKDNANEFRCI